MHFLEDLLLSLFELFLGLPYMPLLNLVLAEALVEFRDQVIHLVQPLLAPNFQRRMGRDALPRRCSFLSERG